MHDFEDWKEAYFIQKKFVDRTEKTKRKLIGLGIETTMSEDLGMRKALTGPKYFRFDFNSLFLFFF